MASPDPIPPSAPLRAIDPTSTLEDDIAAAVAMDEPPSTNPPVLVPVSEATTLELRAELARHRLEISALKEEKAKLAKRAYLAEVELVTLAKAQSAIPPQAEASPSADEKEAVAAQLAEDRTGRDPAAILKSITAQMRHVIDRLKATYGNPAFREESNRAAMRTSRIVLGAQVGRLQREYGMKPR